MRMTSSLGKLLGRDCDISIAKMSKGVEVIGGRLPTDIRVAYGIFLVIDVRYSKVIEQAGASQVRSETNKLRRQTINESP